jgi:hypothetical protein
LVGGVPRNLPKKVGETNDPSDYLQVCRADLQQFWWYCNYYRGHGSNLIYFNYYSVPSPFDGAHIFCVDNLFGSHKMQILKDGHRRELLEKLPLMYLVAEFFFSYASTLAGKK